MLYNNCSKPSWFHHLDFTYPLASWLHSLPGNILGSTIGTMVSIIRLDVGAESSSVVSVEVVHAAQHFKVERNLHSELTLSDALHTKLFIYRNHSQFDSVLPLQSCYQFCRSNTCQRIFAMPNHPLLVSYSSVVPLMRQPQEREQELLQLRTRCCLVCYDLRKP